MGNGTLLNKADFEHGSGKIWLDDVICTGYEWSITQCYHRFWGLANCGHSEDVGVVCGVLGMYGIFK
jgi:hypothetical protein